MGTTGSFSSSYKLQGSFFHGLSILNSHLYKVDTSHTRRKNTKGWAVPQMLHSILKSGRNAALWHPNGFQRVKRERI